MSTTETPAYYTAIGAVLALVAATLNGASFVLNKKAFTALQAKDRAAGKTVVAGKGYAYLKNPTWWAGMTCMGLGEVINTVAFAFAPTIIVAPLGAWSVAVTALLSALILKERLSFSGKIGAVLCVLGSVAIAVTSPSTSVPTHTVDEFCNYLQGIPFIVYSVVCAIILACLIFWLAPKRGTKSIMVYVSVASIGGSFLVQFASGVGSSVIYSITNWSTYNVFTDWKLYLLVVILILLILFQIAYVNKAIACFQATIVMPIYFVSFTIWTFITFLFLYGFNSGAVANAQTAIALVLNFLVIVCGVALLIAFNRKAMKALLPEQLHQSMMVRATEDLETVRSQWEGRDSHENSEVELVEDVEGSEHRVQASTDGLVAESAPTPVTPTTEMVQLAPIPITSPLTIPEVPEVIPSPPVLKDS